MEPERWRRIEQLYHLALEQPKDSRAAFVAETCGDDGDLRQEIESLLAADEGAESYLEKPAIQEMASIARGAPSPASGLPKRVGRYVIAGRLGSGSMGTVYRGIDPVISRTVAIKTIAPLPNVRGSDGLLENAPEKHAGGLDLRSRLLREARAAGSLSHPNIVTVFDAGEEAGVTYIVMELIEGSTLETTMPVLPALLPTPRVLAILAEVAAALDYAHSRGVVHRDIKPSNIMIQTDGVAKLADFGIALLPKATVFTTTGNVPGTPCYMSPEQVRGEDATSRSDQFSLAVLAWLLLTGSRPFDSENLMPLLAQILEQAPLQSARLTPAMDGVLRRALAKRPEERFASCGSFVAALRDACLGESAVVLNVTPPRRLKVWASIAGVICLLAVAGIAWRLGHQAPSPVQPEHTRGAAKQAAIVSSPPVDTQTKPDPPPVRSAPASSVETIAAKARPTAVPLAAGAVKTNAIDHLPYVWIPAAAFDLGCSSEEHGCDPNERPVHHVAFSRGFWIGQTETTVEAYRRFVSTTGHPPPPEPIFAGRNLNPGWADGRQPVVNVTWDDARAFCEWSGLRLPSEAEWEYAARGGGPYPRYGSAEAVSWFRNNSGKAHFDNAPSWLNDAEQYDAALRDNENGPRAVGGKPANGYGLHDMLGNVWEWVNDWFRRNYYAWSPATDPTGPDAGTTRVIRGGSWYDGPRLINPSRRHSLAPASRNVYTGFRCAGSLPGS